MIRSTVPLMLLATLGGAALGLWVSAPSSPHPPIPFNPPPPPTPVLQQSPVVSPQTVRSYPAVGRGRIGLSFEADV